jgi:DNA mismatch repair protein MSH4
MSMRSASRATGSVIGGSEHQRIFCAISEARGTSPTVGLALVNITMGVAVLCQICDNQFYVKTLQKLHIYEPTEILIMDTSAPPHLCTKMYSIINENVTNSDLIIVPRKYWSENEGLNQIRQLAFLEDIEAIQVAIEGKYFATCCFAAVCLALGASFDYSTYETI